MNDEREHSLKVLNELLRAETESLLARLPELWLAITRANAALALTVQRASDQGIEHRHWLVECIYDLHGSPWPVSMDPATAALHYLSLNALVPRVAQSLEHLTLVYTQAAQAKPLAPEAAELVVKMGRRHEANLKSLQQAMAPPRRTALSSN